MESSTAGPSDEDHSERRIRWMIFAIGVVVFVGLLMLGRPLVEGRLAAARNLDRATALIAGTNDELTAIDTSLRAAPASSTTAFDAGTLLATKDLRSTMEEAVLLSQSGYERLTQDEQKRALIVTAMAKARIGVLDAAEAVLTAGGTRPSGPERARALEAYTKALEKSRQADAALAKL